MRFNKEPDFLWHGETAQQKISSLFHRKPLNNYDFIGYDRIVKRL